MKISLKLLLLLAVIGCTKKYDQLEPEVKTLPVENPKEGVLQLRGQVVDNQNFPVIYSGFCYSLDTIPELMDNQILFGETEGEFQTQLKYTEEGVDLYVRAFAANEHSFAYGNVVEFTTPEFAQPQVPCTNPANTVIDNGTSYSVSYADTNDSYSSFGVTALYVSCGLGAPNVYVEFNRIPRNGIYSTAGESRFRNGNKQDVMLRIKHGNYYIANKNQSVYVTETNSGGLRFEFCDLKYSISGQEIVINASVEI